MDVSRSAAPIHLEKGGALFFNEKHYSTSFLQKKMLGLDLLGYLK